MLFVACMSQILFAFITLSSAIQLIPEQTPTDVRIRLGQPYDLNCVVNERWDFCTWYNVKTGSKCQSQGGAEGAECQMFAFGSDHPRVFSYNVAEQTCTLRFSDAVKEDFGTWKCRVLKDGGGNAETNVNVTVYSPTKLSFKTKPHHKVYAGQEEHIECMGKGGFPYPNLLAFVGPKSDHDPVNDVLLNRIDQSSRFNEITQEVEMTSLFQFVPSISQQNYYVKCFSQQSDYENGQVVDVYPLSVLPQPFQVLYKPIRLNQDFVYELEVDKVGVIKVPIEAYPLPANEQIIWHFATDNPDDSIQLIPGQTVGRYTAEPLPMLYPTENATFEVVLIINPVLASDLLSHAYLEVVNEVGPASFNLDIQKKPEIVEPIPVEPSGINAGVIIGICVASLIFITVLVGFSVWYCQKQQLLCFTQSRNYEITSEPQENHMANRNVGRLENGGESAELMAQSGAYLPSQDEVDTDIPSLKRHQDFNGRPKATKRTNSYKTATGRESVPQWPEQPQE